MGALRLSTHAPAGHSRGRLLSGPSPHSCSTARMDHSDGPTTTFSGMFVTSAPKNGPPLLTGHEWLLPARRQAGIGNCVRLVRRGRFSETPPSFLVHFLALNALRGPEKSHRGMRLGPGPSSEQEEGIRETLRNQRVQKWTSFEEGKKSIKRSFVILQTCKFVHALESIPRKTVTTTNQGNFVS